MGYSMNGSCCDFWPDDTEHTIFIESGYNGQTLQSLITIIREKWGDDISLNDIEWSAQHIHIHIHALARDSYEPSDYSEFLRISLTTAAIQRRLAQLES